MNLSSLLICLPLMASSSESSTFPWLLMDRLWFQTVVFTPKPVSASNQNPSEAANSNSSLSFSSSSESNPSSNSSSSTIDCSDEDLAQLFHGVHGSLPIITITPQDDLEEEEKSPLNFTKEARKKTKAAGGIHSSPRLERTLSCKTLAELEQEEVKGFMDLGFIFDKDRVTPRMMSVVPGLQSVEEHENDDDLETVVNRREEEEETKSKRAYLSEAWMVERPDSPILRLRMSRLSTTSCDMKKHLKHWAKAAASSAVHH